MAQQVKEIMTAPPHTVSPDTSIREAAVDMRDSDIGDVVVTDGGRLVGLVTDRDIVVRCVADGADIDSTPVGEAVSGDLTTVAPDDSIDRAIQCMRDKAVRRLPVVDGERVVGVVSLGDLAVERDPSSVLSQISGSTSNT
ncbi:CBS domain-containing protein [Streptomonospora nanhaiensis]|uniref:CBS domain-containing protein n=1 Tax=Streptomonospora nanhaiensis TaxID=1323731 RepID=UPI001C9A2555|nr:CBS domain-containing protein [Streptomonospora nanhaiensis]MBX9387889.1 CBS domain-containing protein [Streptomonospora nanhaiensis]